ncbi:MAG: hypothetical protein ACK5FE_01675, partial [Cyanobacteriota bacterium]
MSRISTPFRLPPLWRSLPLPCTSAAIALLLLVPALLLPRLPRPRAQGLEQLMDTATLLQSFPATPDRPVPALWQERLGPGLAPALWRQQRRTWWQFWGPHADGSPYLAVSAAALPLGSTKVLPPNGLRVGDLVGLAPDPLSRQLLADRLRPRLRPSRGLQRRCLALMESDQAVFWSPLALGVILGPVAPLFQPYQEGCLRLRLEEEGLSWRGEAAAVDGVLASASAASLERPLPSQPPLSADLLLELEGPSLDPLLQGLLPGPGVLAHPQLQFQRSQERPLGLGPQPQAEGSLAQHRHPPAIQAIAAGQGFTDQLARQQALKQRVQGRPLQFQQQ